MLQVPIAKHQQIRQAEEERHDNAVYEIEKAKRLELARFFGVKEELALATDKHGYWVNKWDIIDKQFKKLVQDESGKLVFSTERDGACNQQMPVDGIVFYHGKPPKKNSYSYTHKGFSVTFRIYQAPNGLWIGEACNFRCPPQGHNFGGHRHFHFEVAFENQDEVFAHCVNQAAHTLTGPIDVDKDPQEIEVPCPSCEAWAKANTKKDKNDEGEEYEYVDPNHEGVECPTCKDPYCETNEITRLETPEETKARVEIESKDRGFDPKYQPQAEEFASTLLGLCNCNRKEQLELFA